MSELEIRWPDAGVERVRAARGRLALAGESLRAMPLEARLQATGEVLASWTADDSPWRRALAEELAEATPFSLGTLREGLDAALRAWQPEDWRRCAERELALGDGAGARCLVPFEWTTVLAGGSIPMPTLLAALVPLALGSPVLLRETSADPVTARLLARSLEATESVLARSFEPITLDKADAAAIDALLEAPCVSATGSDETIHAIGRRLRPSQRFVGYGHRFSIAVLGAEVARSAEGLAATVEGLARDVARWDQLGCLSPVVAYLVGVEPADAERLASGIAAALERLGETMPRGELDAVTRAAHATERAEARMRAATGATRLFEGREHTVVLEADARPRPAPLHRFLRMMPVASPADLAAALRPFEGQLSTAAVAGLGDEGGADRAGTVHELLLDSGISRITSPGGMQIPPVDWPHDGRPVFTPFARLARIEAGERP